MQKAYEAAVEKETDIAPVEARIVERAVPLNEKVFPKPGMFAPLVTLAMLLVGLAWSVTRAIVMGPGSTESGGSLRDGTQADSEPVLVPLATRSSTASTVCRGVDAHRRAGGWSGLRSQPSGLILIQMIAAAVAGLLGRDADGACRTLIAGGRNNLDAAAEALALAKSLSAAGKAVVLVDWSERRNVAGGSGRRRNRPGLAQLIQGDVAFEDVNPETRRHGGPVRAGRRGTRRAERDLRS